MEYLGVSLIAAGSATQLVVSHRRVEGRIADAIFVNIEVGPDVLIPGTVIARTDATRIDDIACMGQEIITTLRHLRGHIPCSRIRIGAGRIGAAIAQRGEGELDG